MKKIIYIISFILIVGFILLYNFHETKEEYTWVENTTNQIVEKESYSKGIKIHITGEVNNPRNI